MRDQRVMAKDRDQHETLADLSPEESGWFSASLKHPEAKPEEVIEELREAIPIQMVHVAVAGARFCSFGAIRSAAAVRRRGPFPSFPAGTRKGPPTTASPLWPCGR